MKKLEQLYSVSVKNFDDKIEGILLKESDNRDIQGGMDTSPFPVRKTGCNVSSNSAFRSILWKIKLSYIYSVFLCC